MSGKANGKIMTMPLADLIEDMEIYPRHAVDPSHVQSLAFALEAGAILPPIVADQKSKRITDGWHRGRAYKRIHGAEATVDVELIKYKNLAEMKWDAVCRNAAHGRRLDRIDQTRCILMLESDGHTPGRIALALKIPEERIKKLSIRVATAPGSAGQNVPSTTKIALKRSVRHLEGRSLSQSQAQAHARMPGTSFLLIAKQLALALREGLIDLEDAKLVAQLTELRDLLVKQLA